MQLPVCDQRCVYLSWITKMKSESCHSKIYFYDNFYQENLNAWKWSIRIVIKELWKSNNLLNDKNYKRKLNFLYCVFRHQTLLKYLSSLFDLQVLCCCILAQNNCWNCSFANLKTFVTRKCILWMLHLHLLSILLKSFHFHPKQNEKVHT